MPTRHARLTAISIALCVLSCATPTAHGQFTTVINVPPDLMPATIGSNTQVNVFGDVSASGFTGNVGNPSGSDANIEVNVLGGHAGFLAVNADSTINVSGGGVSSISQRTPVNVNVDVSGGSISGHIRGGDGLRVNLSGGSTNRLYANAGSAFNLIGIDFKLNGAAVGGLIQQGDSVPINLPADSLLTGLLSDGAPFSYSTFVSNPLFPTQGRMNEIADGALTLTMSAPLPPPAAMVINVPSDPMPLGVRGGQTLNLGPNAALQFETLKAARGSIVNVDGGRGDWLDAIGAEVNVRAGYIYDLDAYAGSTIDVSVNGSLGVLDLVSESTANVTGGEIASVYVRSGAVLNLSGGSIQGTWLVGAAGSTINVGGGSVSARLIGLSGATVNWSGGNVEGSVFAFAGATLKLFGRNFLLDGAPVAGLETAGDSLVLTARGGAVLTGLLADGTPFDVVLNAGTTGLPDLIDSAATLQLTVVPEPSGLVLLALSGCLLLRARRPFRWKKI